MSTQPERQSTKPAFCSPASDAVIAAQHPSPQDGGPCATCAFRKGTEANQTEHTMMLAALCVEGLRPFLCHEQPQACRGWIAAVNLRGAPESEDDKRHSEACAFGADVLAECIGSAAEFERQQDKATGR